MNTEINFFHLIFFITKQTWSFFERFLISCAEKFLRSFLLHIVFSLHSSVLFCLECNQISVGRFDVFQERYSYLSQISPLYSFQKELLDPGYLTPQIKFTTPNRRPIFKRKERWISCLNYLSTCLSCISIPALLSEQCSC